MSGGLQWWAAPLASRPSRLWLLVRFGGLTAVLITVLRAEPAEWDGAVVVLWVSAGVSVAGALLWSFGRLRSAEVRIGLVAMLVAFGVMIALAPSSAASVMGGTVAYSAAFDLPMRDSAQIVAAGSPALAVAVLALGDSRRLLLLLVFALMWWAGLSHQQYLKRAEQAELLLTETRRSAEASSMAATLAERARIAREIHDILAHSLSALSIHLEAVAGQLGDHPRAQSDPLLRKAIDGVDRSLVLTKQDLVETRPSSAPPTR